MSGINQGQFLRGQADCLLALLDGQAEDRAGNLDSFYREWNEQIGPYLREGCEIVDTETFLRHIAEFLAHRVRSHFEQLRHYINRNIATELAMQSHSLDVGPGLTLHEVAKDLKIERIRETAILRFSFLFPHIPAPDKPTGPGHRETLTFTGTLNGNKWDIQCTSTKTEEMHILPLKKVVADFQKRVAKSA